MDRIHRLPFISGGFMAVVTGIASYAWGSDTKTTYIRMAVMMVVFYIIGAFVKNTLLAIKKETEEKKEREKQKELEEAEAAAKAQDPARQETAHGGKGQDHRVDLVADYGEEEFTPMTVSQVISTKIKE